MSYNFYTFNNLDSAQKTEVADLIAAYTTGELGEQPNMLPVTSEDVHNKHLGIVALNNETGAFGGYIGATQPTEHDGHNMSEVGTLWVPSDHRKQGNAHELVSSISSNLVKQSIVPYAFGNVSSTPIFKSLSYKEATSSEIPPVALELCFTDCKKILTLGRCCDTLLILQDGATS